VQCNGSCLLWAKSGHYRPCGYTFASTAVPIYGLTVLTPIYGGQVAAGIVGLAALVTNLAQVSVAVFLLQSAFSELGSAGRQTLWRASRCGLVF
jgi:hypothetical protein